MLGIGTSKCGASNTHGGCRHCFERLERACSEGVWERDVARQLAEEFIDEDLAKSVRAEGSGPPTVEEGAQSLWMMAVNVCRDAFPDGEIEKGPPSP